MKTRNTCVSTSRYWRDIHERSSSTKSSRSKSSKISGTFWTAPMPEPQPQPHLRLHRLAQARQNRQAPALEERNSCVLRPTLRPCALTQGRSENHGLIGTQKVSI